MNTDWQGREIPADEPDDAVIDVWEVEPHLGNDHYTHLVERSWQDMLKYVGSQLDFWLEQFDEDDLREGVTIKLRVRKMSKSEYAEYEANAYE